MSKSSSSNSFQMPIDPAFDQKFATSFVDVCMARFQNNADNLTKLILTAPLSESAPGIPTPSLLWNSMQSEEFSASERPVPYDDQPILNLYLRNLDAIKENLTAKIVTLENSNDEQKEQFTSALNEACEILQDVKSRDPKISLGQIWYDEKEDKTASIIQLSESGSCYYGRVKLIQTESNIDDPSYCVSGEIIKVREGKGTKITTNGKCKGDFVNGHLNGLGVYKFSDGVSYEGEFKDDRAHGNGVLTGANGDIYAGAFAHGLPNGKGAFYGIDGSKYNGDWVSGSHNGKGTETEANGDKYVGDFLDGLRNGKGVLIAHSGDIYDGDWVDGLMHGKGILKFTNNDKYIGNFRNGQPNGTGIIKFVNGDKYEGNWKDGEYSGTGVLEYANGNKYVGNFADNKKSGEGTLILADGTRLRGHWADDHRIESAINEDVSLRINTNDDAANPGIEVHSPNNRPSSVVAPNPIPRRVVNALNNGCVIS